MRFVENGSVLVGMLPSGSVRREAVFVDDMKEAFRSADAMTRTMPTRGILILD